MDKEVSHVHIMFERGLDVRSVLETAAESIVNGRIACDGIEVRDEKVYMVKDMGKREVLIKEGIPGREFLTEELRGRNAIGMYIRRKECSE